MKALFRSLLVLLAVIPQAYSQQRDEPLFPVSDEGRTIYIDRKGNVAGYANRGSFVDVIAPGISLVDYQGQSYLVRGTSAATAYVSGTAAGFRANGSAAPNVEAFIRQNLAIKPTPGP